MDLIHNNVFRILTGDEAGLYRVILNEHRYGFLVVVRLDPPDEPNKARRGRKKLAKTKRTRKNAPPRLIGQLIWKESDKLKQLDDAKQLLKIEIESENFKVSKADETLYSMHCTAMQGFLDFDNLRERILVDKGIGGLVGEAVAASGKSSSLIYKLFSQLCRFGFAESSLRPRRDRCGGKGKLRPCDGERKKAGAKTTKQKIAKAFGQDFPPEQPGMSTEWRHLIITADRNIPSPKPAMPQRIIQIVESAFVRKYRQDGNQLTPVDPVLGEYPNNRQIRRVLETDIEKLQRILEKTTKGHFARNMRGLHGKNWEGVSGPGHTWAIDSTIGDVYLRSSVNRAWIIGRPIVYIVVDVWSTAIVGFYVCLTGPSWDTAKVSLFCSAAPPELVGELWGYQPILSLNPLPTMCAVLLCDRGEYLSKGASITGTKLIPCLSYTPPYRPDLKGLVEVLHRIAKDKQYFFVPGAIDQRRQEFELRKFDPNTSVLTVRDYTQYLYTIFTEYNLTANRSHRLDAHMTAAGVFPSPAGLWRWGHEVGLGVRRALPLSELINNLLPSDIGTVTRNGIRFAGKQYESEIVDELQWTAYARNFGSWDISSNYFPGSVSKIWVPNPTANGLLDLKISDYSTASPELTFDEVADAFAVGQSKNAEIEHVRTIHALQSLRKVKEIVDNAKELTAEAIARYSGPIPTISESRTMETSLEVPTASQPSTSAQPAPSTDEANEAHLEMMRLIFAAANDKEGRHD